MTTGSQRIAPLKWLSLEKPEDRSYYGDIWARSRFKRPHDHLGFLDLMTPAGYEASAVLFQGPGGSTIVYPFFQRFLNDLPAFRSLRDPCYHLLSPYGYGGALYEGEEEHRAEASHAFEEALRSELSRRGFVSEFVREDIFTHRLALRMQGEVLAQQPNVVVRLKRTDDDIWRAYKPKVRKNVTMAKRAGLQVLFDRHGENLESFFDVYHETMERIQAAQSFFIARERFEKLNRTLGKESGLLYVHVLDDTVCVSTELLLLSRDTVYSFLGGTRVSAFDKRPNDLLKHEVILWARENGFAWYVLGGGVTPGDSIYKYKEAFDPESILPFTVRRLIHNQEIYDRLLAERARFEQAQGHAWRPRADFFPQYLS